MIESLIGAIAPSVIVGLVLAYWERRTRKQEQVKKQIEEAKIDSDLIRIDLEVATAQLAYAVAMAVKRGTPNGEIEVAVQSYEKAMEKFRRFERKQLARTCND